MSYAQAMRRGMHKLNLGHTFNTGSGSWPSPWANQRECPKCEYYKPAVFFENTDPQTPCCDCDKKDKEGTLWTQ